MSEQDTIGALREALVLSPENRVLRLHLARLLMAEGDLADAEQVLRMGLQLRPQDRELKLGLAECFFEAGQVREALVVLEDLQQTDAASPKELLFYARVLLFEGEKSRAAEVYANALDMDPSVEDSALSEQLSAARRTPPPIPKDQSIPPIDPWGERLAGRQTLEQSVILEKPSCSFSDVGGMEALKEEIRMQIINPILHRALYAAYGKVAGGGILMYGPPGCGKTYIARATAGEVDASFIAVGIEDVLDMWVGNSEKNLHQIFELARRNTPCVLFFDEVDALGASRNQMGVSGARQTINQFLAELDGIKSNNDGILIMAATNAPWHMDSAFRRPGRFDKIFFVPPPDLAARREILAVHLRNIPSEDIDLDALAGEAGELSAADLRAVVDLAVQAKLKDAIRDGTPAPLRTDDLRTSLKSVTSSCREWFITAKNYAKYANEGGRYDDIQKYLDS